MSSTLVWKPVKSYSGTLPDELKHALAKSDDWNQYDGGTYTEESIPFLKGLSIGGVKGADKLIKLIEKHGEVELSLEY